MTHHQNRLSHVHSERPHAPAEPGSLEPTSAPTARHRRDRQPFTLYQVAGIYALTSRQEPEDRREAFRLLAAALREGTGLDLIDRDRDLDPIRKQPEFRSLVEAARALRAGASPQ